MVKQNRNELCDCGSGKKYKVCHGKLDKGFKGWLTKKILHKVNKL